MDSFPTAASASSRISTLLPLSSRAATTVANIDQPVDGTLHENGERQYASSSTTLSRSFNALIPSTPHSRPRTASGRRSRATTMSSILGQTDTGDVVCAVCEARGVTPSVGVAFVNVALGEVALSQICDNQSFVKTIHKMQMMSPSRIVCMASACPPNAPSTLYSLIREHVADCKVDILDRSAWSEIAGLEYIDEMALEGDIEPLKVAVSGKYYAVASLSAAMKYIEQHFAVTFAPRSLRIHYQPSDDTMMIDISAFQSLEIMRNLQDAKSKDSLFGLLNHTSTPMGTRMLRSNILQPPTSYDTFIRPRYDALEELTTNEEMFGQVRKALKLFHDTEKLLTKIIIISTTSAIFQVEEQINNVLLMKSFLESVPKLCRALRPAQSPLLMKIRNACVPQTCSTILDLISEVIEPDVTYFKSPLDLRNQRTFAVKSGLNGMLDVARQTYKELTEEIHSHVDQINEEYGVGATLRFDNGRKYWLRLNVSCIDELDSVPDIFINIVRRRGDVQCQTLDLVKLNLRLSDTSNEVVVRSDNVIHALIVQLRHSIPDLFRMSESVALLDMLSSFAQLSTTHDYVRPEIGSTLALKSARHPILDKRDPDSLIPNDYYAAEQYRFHIVTGCNMSGKSTYIRAVALLQIMAQIGCFVPAEFAAFPLIHHIFARVSMNDMIESNLSTFSVEMREMAFILRNIDGKSLAIIDELGRGTSPRDGLAIAIAISEALIQSNASVWFVTHLTELARVLASRSGVLNLHLAVTTSVTQEGLPHLTMLYKATSGFEDKGQHYGVNLARAIGLPTGVTDKAVGVASALRQKREANRQNAQSKKLHARRNLILGLHDSLKNARDSTDCASLPNFLARLQEEFVLRMEEIGQM